MANNNEPVSGGCGGSGSPTSYNRDEWAVNEYFNVYRSLISYFNVPEHLIPEFHSLRDYRKQSWRMLESGHPDYPNIVQLPEIGVRFEVYNGANVGDIYRGERYTAFRQFLESGDPGMWVYLIVRNDKNLDLEVENSD